MTDYTDGSIHNSLTAIIVCNFITWHTSTRLDHWFSFIYLFLPRGKHWKKNKLHSCLPCVILCFKERKWPPPHLPKRPAKGRGAMMRERSLDLQDRQRQEARRRLMAAKRAASFRQNSATERADSIEIYIPEAQTRLWGPLIHSPPLLSTSTWHQLMASHPASSRCRHTVTARSLHRHRLPFSALSLLKLH